MPLQGNFQPITDGFSAFGCYDPVASEFFSSLLDWESEMAGVNKELDAELEKSAKKAVKAFDSNTLRKIWASVKASGIKEAEKKADDKTSKALKKIFTKDLGPTLDKFDKEISKFPKQDLAKIEKYKDLADDIISDYITDIGRLDFSNKKELKAILVEIGQKLTKRVHFFKMAAEGKIISG